MKHPFTLLFLFFLFACSNNKSKPSLFTPSILAQQLFSIDPSKDTLLETLHGSVIRVASGTFNITGDVQLEIREAFTPAEMLAAGMATESNGRPLRSGGMIYINATTADGKALDLVKAIKISVPNPYYDSAMQVFSGIQTDSAGINWVEPSPVDSTPQSANWILGKELFRKCMSCHSLFYDLTGPALANVENRGPWTDRKKLYEYIRAPWEFMAKDKYTSNLRARYGSVMTGFGMTNYEIDAILDYIKNESKRPGALEDEEKYRDSLSRIERKNNAADSSSNRDGFGSFKEKPCGDDTVYIPIPRQNFSFFDGETSFSTTPYIGDTIPVQPRYLDDPASRSNEFTDPNPTNGMYDFEIRTLGWYNIDAFMEGYVGTTIVRVWAQVQTDADIYDDIHVYLFCPEKQVLSVGYDRQGDKYMFNKIDDGVPLFLGDRAILFAFGSKKDKMYYGISEFIINAEQTIPVNIMETTDEEIRQALLSKQLDGIDLGIEKKEKVILKRPCSDTLSKTIKDTGAIKK